MRNTVALSSGIIIIPDPIVDPLIDTIIIRQGEYESLLFVSI